MPKYSPDTLRSLLAHDEDNITLADELQSAIAHTIGKRLGDKNLAVFALADDLLEVMLPALAGVDLNTYEVEPEDDTEEAGDIYEREHGLTVITPHGDWDLHDEEVLKLITGLSTMLHHRLDRPWSDTNPSTILTRGRITAHLHEGVF